MWHTMGVIHIGDTTIYNDMPYGWAKGKGQPEWHERVYSNWYIMWHRCKDPNNIRYEHYKDCIIHDDWIFLSKYIAFYEAQPNFQEFINHPELRWAVGKGKLTEGNRTYGPDTCCLRTSSDNTKNRNMRRGNPTPPKPVIGISIKFKPPLLFKSTSDSKQKGFTQGNISSCCRKAYCKNTNIYKGYRWYFVSYKHNKIYRIKEI